METLLVEKKAQTETKPEIKTYVLLDIMDSQAPIYQQIPGGKREQIKKIPFYRPYLQITFTDENGKNRTLRYKGNTDKIYQDEQIKDGILANEQFTQTERSGLYFRHGSLTTNKPTMQRFLEAHPQFEGFTGIRDDGIKAEFKILDKAKNEKNNNSEIRIRTKAATKILSLDLEEAQAMLIRLNGAYFQTPNDIDECQNMLIQFLDDAEMPGVEEILKEEKELNIDQHTGILLGKLINKEMLSFDQVEGKVSKKDKQGKKWIVVRDMSKEYSMDEKLRLFSDFLNTNDGKALKNDLEADLAKVEKKAAANQN